MFSEFQKSLRWKKKALKATIRRKVLERFGVNAFGVAVRAESGAYIIDPADAGVGKQLLTTGEYNRDEIEKIATFLFPQSKVPVVGAHIGSLVIPLSRRCKSLTAIEANPRTFELLNLNLRLNGCSNVEVFSVAASDRAGEIEFLINRENSGGSKRRPLREKPEYVYDAPEIRKVSSVPLDELLTGREFDLILLDIEGSEYFALQGMTRLLASAKHLIVEFRPEHLKNIAGLG